MYALSQNGLWESSDFTNFTQIATPPSSDPNAFMPVPVSGGYNSDAQASIEAYNGSLWCGSSMNGKVYNVTVSATAVPEKPNHDLKFESIYPNPFTAFTNFYTTKPMDNATMIIYNSLGESVRVVKNINGSSFTISRDNLPNGIYSVQLSLDNITIASDKMIITGQ